MQSTAESSIEILGEDQEPQRKKRKLSSPEEDISDVEGPSLSNIASLGQDRIFLLSCLSNLIREHPNALENTKDLFFSELGHLSNQQLANLIQLIQTQEGLIAPYANAKALLGIANAVLDGLFKSDGMLNDCISDPEIVSSIDKLLMPFNFNTGKLKLVEKIAEVASSKFFKPRDTSYRHQPSVQKTIVPIETVHPLKEVIVQKDQSKNLPVQTNEQQATKTLPIVSGSNSPTEPREDSRPVLPSVPTIDNGTVRSRKNHHSRRDNK
jgi:hypothetical protein